MALAYAIKVYIKSAVKCGMFLNWYYFSSVEGIKIAISRVGFKVYILGTITVKSWLVEIGVPPYDFPAKKYLNCKLLWQLSREKTRKRNENALINGI